MLIDDRWTVVVMVEGLLDDWSQVIFAGNKRIHFAGVA
jgi:hypothetical protein